MLSSVEQNAVEVYTHPVDEKLIKTPCFGPYFYKAAAPDKCDFAVPYQDTALIQRDNSVNDFLSEPQVL